MVGGLLGVAGMMKLRYSDEMWDHSRSHSLRLEPPVR